jgi:tRNA threonylcarbamoyladenosine biosynthesis protein TsaE
VSTCCTCLSFQLPDEAATARVGAALGAHCPRTANSPLVLYLCGALGAGKTTLARALLGALGHAGTVRSPSYTLVEPYAAGGLTVLHADLYRLQGAEDWRSLGVNDELDAETLLLVEWPERGADALPPADLQVELTLAGSGRQGRLTACSSPGEAWLAMAAAELPDLQGPSR